MIDLNPHVPSGTQQRIGSLAMSERALAGLAGVFPAGPPTEENLRSLLPIVAQSAAGFLVSAYFARSEWFRAQPVHTLPAFRIEPDITPIVHLRRTRHGHVIEDPADAPVPEDYPDKRVVQEVIVETAEIGP